MRRLTASGSQGIYPTVVVILVKSKRSVLDPKSEGSGGLALSSLHFKNRESQSVPCTARPSVHVFTGGAVASPTLVDWYEMARLGRSVSAEDSDCKDGGSVTVTVKDERSEVSAI